MALMIGGLAAMLLAAILFPLCKEEEREPSEQHAQGPQIQAVLKEYSKSVGSADFRHRDARYVARLSSPHAYIML